MMRHGPEPLRPLHFLYPKSKIMTCTVSTALPHLGRKYTSFKFSTCVPYLYLFLLRNVCSPQGRRGPDIAARALNCVNGDEHLGTEGTSELLHSPPPAAAQRQRGASKSSFQVTGLKTISPAFHHRLRVEVGCHGRERLSMGYPWRAGLIKVARTNLPIPVFVHGRQR